jgi:TfoX/Sxy family transcriptional regulator of competence genes
MELPKPAAASVKLFAELTPSGPTVTSKLVFGNPAVFVNGNMFFGVFADHLFVRLTEASGAPPDEARSFPAFEPMPGRPMRGYYVLPPAVLKDRAASRRWVERSLAFASGLPPKKPKRK